MKTFETDFSSETEKKIIESATLIFLEKGKDGARMQEIADRAEINKALLHYYFRSKDRLYDSVFITVVSGFIRQLLDVVHETTDAELLINRFVDGYIDALARRPGVVRFILWEIDQGGERFREVLTTVLAEHGFSRVPFPDMLAAAIQSGGCRRVDPAQLMLSLLGMCLYPFIARNLIEKLFPQLDITSPEFIARRKKEIVDLVLYGIRSSGA